MERRSELPRQIPVPDELSKPFWDAVNERRLVVQSCTACNALQYPPRPRCEDCGSETLEWKDTSGRGSISGYIVIHDSRMRVWSPEVPYNVAIIQLEEDPTINFFANLPGTPVDDVPVGAPTEVIFEEVAPGQLVPDWQVVS
jgi:uncharacterized OB-fold protein